MDTFIPKIFFNIINITNFHGEITDILARKQALVSPRTLAALLTVNKIAPKYQSDDPNKLLSYCTNKCLLHPMLCDSIHIEVASLWQTVAQVPVLGSDET